MKLWESSTCNNCRGEKEEYEAPKLHDYSTTWLSIGLGTKIFFFHRSQMKPTWSWVFEAPGSLWMICMDLNQKLLSISSLLNRRLMSPLGWQTLSWHLLSWIGQFDTVHRFYIWINKGIWMESSTAGSFGCICALLTLLLTQYYQHMFVLASEKVNQASK